MSFTKELQDHFKKMGWSKGRRVKEYDSFMEEYNYPEFIRAFIREYGGINVLELIDERFKQSVVNNASLNPLDSGGMDVDSVAVDWSKDLGRKLYVIGLYSPETFDIAADENGAVYFLGEYLLCVGKGLYRGVESIIRYDNKSLELDPKDPTSGIWRDVHANIVDFNTYEFKYDTFD